MFRSVQHRLYVLVAAWGFFLGMLTAACSGRGDATGGAAGHLDAYLPAPTGMAVHEQVAATDGTLRAWLRTAVEQEFGPGDPSALTRFWGLAVAESGNVYALDSGAQQVEVIAPDGASLGVLGGPDHEAFASALGVTVAGDRVFVVELNPLRLTSWDLAGKRLSAEEPEQFIGSILGLADGTLVAKVMGFGPLPETLSALSATGQEIVRFTELPELNAGAMDRETRDLWSDNVVAAAGDRVYVAATDSYEVLAFEPGGEPLWAVRARWPREAIPEELIQRSLERTRRAGRAMRSTVVAGMDRGSWPDYFPALANIEVDGHGRLYVFPFVRNATEFGQFPVDVYTPDGILIVHGMLPFQGWEAQLSDCVYRIEEVDGAARIRRYGLAMPRPVDVSSPGHLVGR